MTRVIEAEPETIWRVSWNDLGHKGFSTFRDEDAALRCRTSRVTDGLPGEAIEVTEEKNERGRFVVLVNYGEDKNVFGGFQRTTTANRWAHRYAKRHPSVIGIIRVMELRSPNR